MKFEHGKTSPFYKHLTLEVENYFTTTKQTRFATSETFIKGGLIMLLYLTCYIGIYFFQHQYTALVICYLVLGWSGVMLVFNLVHDASHQAISKHKQINNSIRYIGDLVGINTYIWDIRHNMQHHTFTNVLGGDLIIDSIPLIRLSPHQPYKKYHAYQLYYAPFLYLLYSFYWMFFIDFVLFFKKDICNLKNLKHPLKEWVLLFFFKTLYVTYMILLPAFFTDMGILTILALFMIMHFAAGLLLSFIAVLGHFVEGPSFPEPLNGILPTSWSEHELEATIDFAPSSRIINWITGGLNTHVAHHLFPQICHSHYYALTPIIENYCCKNGYAYKKETFYKALRSHFNYLKQLAKPV